MTIGGRGIVMDYLCAKFGDFVILVSAVLILSCGQTDRQTEAHATTVGVSNYRKK